MFNIVMSERGGKWDSYQKKERNQKHTEKGKIGVGHKSRQRIREKSFLMRYKKSMNESVFRHEFMRWIYLLDLMSLFRVKS